MLIKIEARFKNQNTFSCIGEKAQYHLDGEWVIISELRDGERVEGARISASDVMAIFSNPYEEEDNDEEEVGLNFFIKLWNRIKSVF